MTVMEEDLRICLVRPLMDIERRFCFEIISPTKSHVLQADTEDLYKRWITSLQQGISSALHADISKDDSAQGASGVDADQMKWEDSDNEDDDKKKKRSRPSAKQILLIHGNEKCADCGADDPEWASINFGITLCIACSGIHRSLGVHISKVRSIKLDAFEPEILKVMAEIGNDVSNKIYEANVAEVIAKRATPDCPSDIRENWIKAKYLAKAFINVDALKSYKSKATAKTKEGGNPGGASAGNNSKDVWTVRRLRRRAKLNRSHQSDKESRDKDDKDEDTTETKPTTRIVRDDSDSSILEACGLTVTKTVNVINAEDILFGSTLRKHHLANIELDSDQESTDGEDAALEQGDPIEKLSANMLLFRAARVHNVPVMSQAIALGADRDWINDETKSCAIHQSIVSGSVMACEFLLLNGAKINAADGNGNTPLHLAATHGSTGKNSQLTIFYSIFNVFVSAQVCLLLKHRALHQVPNNQGQTALDIAVKNSDADVVTLLRLAALNEEIRENDMTGVDDETYDDVIKEFTHMVYTHPERLHKKSEPK